MKRSSFFTRRKMVAAVMVLFVAAAGWHWYTSAAQEAQPAGARTITVVRGDIEEVVTSQGKLEPKQYVDVGTQVSGQIKRIHVDIGAAVERDQLLAEIDPRVFQAQVEAGEARLKSLRAELEQRKAQAVLAEQNLKRNQNLVAVNAVSRQALQETQSQARVARAQVDAVRAQILETESNLKASRTNLEFTKIYAPMAGTVTTMPTKEGQTLNANQTAPVLLQVANLETMTVRAQVAEADVSRLRPGMPAYFTTLGNSEQRWSAEVRQILPTPQIVNDVVLYDVLLDVDNEDGRLMTGMTTQVFFILGQAEDALIVPAEVLARRVPERDNESGKAYRVAVLGDEGRKPRVIHVGLVTRTQAQVVGGLSQGDRVALGRPAAAAGEGREAQRRGSRRATRGPVL